MQKRIRKIIAPSFTIKKTNLNVVKVTQDSDATPQMKKESKREVR